MTDVFGEGRSFTAHLPERIGDSKVLVDGVDITRAVSWISFDAWGEGRAVTVRLDMCMVEAATVTAHAVNVIVSPESAELLLGAGWLTPDVAEHLYGVVQLVRQWVRGECMAVDLTAAVTAYEKAVDGG